MIDKYLRSVRYIKAQNDLLVQMLNERTPALSWEAPDKGEIFMYEENAHGPRKLIARTRFQVRSSRSKAPQIMFVYEVALETWESFEGVRGMIINRILHELSSEFLDRIQAKQY